MLIIKYHASGSCNFNFLRLHSKQILLLGLTIRNSQLILFKINYILLKFSIYQSMRRDQGYDYLAKLLIIGDSGVGKTNILLRFCQNNFMASHLTTIGIDFKIKTIEVEGKKIRMQIWDTAGQQRFKTITQTYYKGAMGIIMTYAVNDLQSFNALENWMRQIKTHASQNVVKILVGNKSDCTNRQVSYQQGKELANSFGIQFFEMSAKEDQNVQQAFLFIGKQIKEKILRSDQAIDSKPKGPRIGKQNDFKPTEKNKSCC